MWERSIILPNLQNNALIDKACTKKSFVCHQTKLYFSCEYLPNMYLNDFETSVGNKAESNCVDSPLTIPSNFYFFRLSTSGKTA